MRKSSVLALSLAASLLIFSCNRDDISPKQEIPKEFSEKTVEENKAQLESNGIEMIGQMEELKEVAAVEVSTHLLGLFSQTGEGDMGGSAGGRILASLAGIRKGNASATEVFSAMRLNGPVPEGEPETLEDFFATYAGTYKWVSSTEEWDFTAGGEDLFFEFPSTEGGSNNNAVLSIHDYAGVKISNPVDEEYTGELPTRLMMHLTVDGKEEMEYSFSAAYNNNGEPTSIKTSLTLTPFTFAVNLTNNTEEIGAAYSLTRGEKVLIAMGAGAEGNFDTSNLGNSENPEEIVKEASAYFQLLNIKVAGNLDAENLIKEVNALTGDPQEKSNVTKQVTIYNKYYELSVFYAKEKEKIADTEFYVDSYTREIYEYDEVSGEWVITEEEYFAPNIRLIFADGSKADLETYFETGFEDMEEELETFFNSFE